MRRYDVARVWLIACLILVSGLGELTSHAQLLRCRRAKRACRSVCCPTPCETSFCAPRAQECVCVIQELYHSTGYWLYYAHHHADNTICNDFTPFLFESSAEHDPMLCGTDICIDPSRKGTGSLSGLPRPIGAGDDLSGHLSVPPAAVSNQLSGKVILPDNTQIFARVALLKIKLPDDRSGVEKFEWLGFGLESSGLASDVGQFPTVRATKHQHAGNSPRNVYEIKVGPLTCHLLVSDH